MLRRHKTRRYTTRKQKVTLKGLLTNNIIIPPSDKGDALSLWSLLINNNNEII